VADRSAAKKNLGPANRIARYFGGSGDGKIGAMPCAGKRATGNEGGSPSEISRSPHSRGGRLTKISRDADEISRALAKIPVDCRTRSSGGKGGAQRCARNLLAAKSGGGLRKEFASLRKTSPRIAGEPLP
jgi:hypothetical protein